MVTNFFDIDDRQCRSPTFENCHQQDFLAKAAGAKYSIAIVSRRLRNLFEYCHRSNSQHT